MSIHVATGYTPPLPADGSPCTLTRRQRLLVAIWEAWRDGRNLPLRELVRAAGCTSTGGASGTLQTLVRQGWLRKSRLTAAWHHGTQVQHKYLPGERFGGIDRTTGRPLYIVRDEDSEPGMKQRRKTKYERGGMPSSTGAECRGLASELDGYLYA